MGQEAEAETNGPAVGPAFILPIYLPGSLRDCNGCARSEKW